MIPILRGAECWRWLDAHGPLQDDSLSDTVRTVIGQVRSRGDDALLELARESHQSVHHEPLLFNDLAELVVEQLRETQPNPDVHLDVINNGFLSLSGSPKLIRILLTNLLKNALAYTDRGRVEVIIDAEGFSVKDTGMGIEEDKLARIFDPFYRIDHRREKGFGLGLAIVQKVCQELEWEISVSSQPGEGSCFQVNVAAT